MNRPRLLLADDHRIVVEGLRSILAQSTTSSELSTMVENSLKQPNDWNRMSLLPTSPCRN
jgi:DNA-binding NarL/FixJ family response regulator